MAILGKIRQRSFFLILVIGLALFAFVISGIFEGAGDISQEPVAIIGDEELLIEDFSVQVDYAEQRFNMSNIEAAKYVWEQQLSSTILNIQFETLELNAGKSHIEYFIQNDPNFKQDQRFQNEVGLFDLALFLDFIADLKFNNPSGFEQWKIQEESIRNNILGTQYMNLVKAGIYVTEFEGEIQHKLENDKINISYVKVPYTSIPDSLINISDGEIKSYIKKHKNKYNREATRDIQFVVFEEVPSTEDNLDTENELKSLMNVRSIYNEVSQQEEELPSIATAQDIASFVAEYSDIPYQDQFFRESELSGTYAKTLFGLEVDDVFGPFIDGDYMKLTRMVERQTNGSVNARHILISYQGAQNVEQNVLRSKEEARIEANRILGMVKKQGADFADLARNYSNGPSKSRGGDLGFFSQGDMVKNFDTFAFSKPKGSIGLVETDFGFHIIEILDKEDVVKLATIAKKLVPSEKTSNQVFAKATQFELDLKDENFSDLASANEYNVKTASKLKILDESLPSIGNQRRIVQWLFNEDSSVGDIKRFNLSGSAGGYAIVQLTAASAEGLAAVDEVRESITSILVNKKKASLIIDENKNSPDLKSLAEKYNTTINASSAINQFAGTIAGAGSEPFVIGSAFNFDKDAITPIIEGKQGVFMIKLDFKSNNKDLDSYLGYSSSLLSTQQATIEQKVIAALKEIVTVEDNRYVYY